MSTPTKHTLNTKVSYFFGYTFRSERMNYKLLINLWKFSQLHIDNYHLPPKAIYNPILGYLFILKQLYIDFYSIEATFIIKIHSGTDGVYQLPSNKLIK